MMRGYRFVNEKVYYAKIKIKSHGLIIKDVKTENTNLYKRFYFLKNCKFNKMNVLVSNCMVDFVVNMEKHSILILEEMTLTEIIDHVYRTIDTYKNIVIDDYCCNLLNFNIYQNDELLNFDKEFIKNIINKFNFGNGLQTKFIDIMKMHGQNNITKISFIKIPSFTETIYTDLNNITLNDIVYDNNIVPQLQIMNNDIEQINLETITCQNDDLESSELS